MKILTVTIFAGLLLLGGCGRRSSSINWEVSEQEELKIFRATFRVMASPEGEPRKKFQLESQKITDEILKSHGCPTCQFVNLGPEGALIMAPTLAQGAQAPQAPPAPASPAPPPGAQGKR